MRARDCLGREVKEGDWICYTNSWKGAPIEVAQITNIVLYKKDGNPRKYPVIEIKQSYYTTTVNRKYYFCKLERPFKADEGQLGIHERYKM